MDVFHGMGDVGLTYINKQKKYKMDVLTDLCLHYPKNTMTHIHLEASRDMILHGNYEYALELLKQSKLEDLEAMAKIKAFIIVCTNRCSSLAPPAQRR